MPSASYYQRQAETLLALSVATTDPDRAAHLQAWAAAYRTKAIELEDAARHEESAAGAPAASAASGPSSEG